MAESIDQVLRFVDHERDRFLSELIDFLKIPSVSADPRFGEDMLTAAEHLRMCLDRAGLHAEVHETQGHPVVFAQTEQNASRPTVLVYGHYDVQPPDPLELWNSGPFEPRIAEGRLYARGAADDKGQLFTHIKSAEAYAATGVGLPVNLKFIVEGEEEVGSPNLPAYLDANLERIRADAVVISDGSFFGEHPSITYALRGVVMLELDLFGPDRDVHSGMYGGALDNPATVLARMVAKLHDEKGAVAVPGFYDDVLPLTDADRERIGSLPFDENAFKLGTGVPALGGDPRYSVLERLWVRPTLELNGFTSGYGGEGSKTIIPARANAKLSMRIVPGQSPEKVAACVERFLREICPPTVRLKITGGHGARAALVPLDSAAMQAAARAMAKGFGREPVFVREGASIPIVVDLHERLKVPVVLLNFGRNDDNAHSPNEKFDLDHFHRGIVTSAHFYRELADS